MGFSRKAKFAICATLLASHGALASPNYHLVGWFNAFVPGGGQLLLGHPVFAATQATLEVWSFYQGYRLSARSPMTLDGVPEQLPTYSSSVISTPKTVKNCKTKDKKGKCIAWSTTTTSSSQTVIDNTPQDMTIPLYADLLQEFGIKFHFINTFNSYREAAKLGGNSKGIDQTSTLGLFAAPFRPSNVADPWVWGGLAVSAIGLVANYFMTVNAGLTATPLFTSRSQALYDATYGVIFPFGSGVPEEMFYRGFLQNEFYSWVPSPWFAIPLSTAAYTASHSTADMPSAAITGLYEGLLVHRNQGQLSRAITFHFWADVLAGLETIALLRKSQMQPASTSSAAIAQMSLQFDL